MTPSSAVPRCTPEQVDEAAVWMTLLRGSTRNEQTEAGFRRWLAADPAHPSAFEKVSVAYEVTAALPKGAFPRVSRWQRLGYRQGFARAGLAAAAVLILALGALLFLRDAGIATHIGEQRTLTLEDGTQVYLNTSTHLTVDYSREHRHVRLSKGEAYFDVAQDVRRPFEVTAAGRTITALGTAFVVRNDPRDLTVTLIEGKVAVSGDMGTNAVALSPGERVRFATNRSPRLDRPRVSEVTAWRTGRVEFERTPLEAAVIEMNRYSPVKLSVVQGAATHIPITGIFRAGASRSFAAAVADAYGLHVIERSHAIELSDEPQNVAEH